MKVQQGLDGKPKEFIFGDGPKKQRQPRIIQDPNKIINLEKST